MSSKRTRWGLVVWSVCLMASGAARGGPEQADFVKPIAKAHNAPAYYSHGAVRAAIDVTFEGNHLFDGVVLFDTPVGRSRLELSDGAVMVFDGQRAWMKPADSPMQPMARFHLLTWPYFLAAPFKLNDPGVHIESQGPREYNGTMYDTARMTFAAGTGDAPDDWYILYRHPQTHRLDAMAYIVTYGRSQQEAEQEPHAVVYSDWAEVEGVGFATRFTFYHWSPEQGIHGEPIGVVLLSQIEFVDPAADAFAKPEGAAESELPGGAQ